MNYTQRFYEGETDYTAMRRLIADSYKLAAPHSYMLLGDLDWWRALLAEPAAFLPTIPLWFAGDTLIGFHWPAEGSGDVMLHPQHRAAEPLMLAYAEQHLRKPATARSAGIADAGEPGHGYPPQPASHRAWLCPQQRLSCQPHSRPGSAYAHAAAARGL